MERDLMLYCSCAVDVVILAGQQLVAIPGWLLKDQNARKTGSRGTISIMKKTQIAYN
jgi:hypothetical protein